MKNIRYDLYVKVNLKLEQQVSRRPQVAVLQQVGWLNIPIMVEREMRLQVALSS